MSGRKKGARIAIIVIAAAFVLILIFAAVIYGVTRVRQDTTAAYVNGAPISAGEIKLRITALKADAISYFDQEYGVKADSEFWERDFDGKTPSEYLRKLALSDAARAKLEQQLAEQYGLISDISFSALRSEMNSVNIDNGSKIKQGLPVLGQKSYTLSTYYEYYFSNLRLSLQKRMSESDGPLYADNERLKSYYEQQKDEYYRKADTCLFYVLTADSADGLSDAAELILTGKIDEASADYPYISIETVRLDDGNSPDYSKRNGELYARMSGLENGEGTDVFTCERGQCVICCVKREFGGYKPFTDVYSALMAQYRADKYEEYIDSLANKYQPSSEPALYKIPINGELE